MKRKFEHPAPSERELSGPQYWRSLDELAQAPGFQRQLEQEFPEGAASLDGVDRRHFMKIMAASFALGGVGMAGCRRPESHILPFGKSVEGLIPGLPLYYATAMPLRRSATPLLAETHQGRPTKLEGNPHYTAQGGGSSLIAQASILDLYDPDRATAHVRQGTTLDADAVNAVLAGIVQNFSGNGGAGLAFLAEESSSPTRARLIESLQGKFPQALWAEYEPVADEAPLAAAQGVFGQAVKPVYHFARAKRIVSIDGDFLSAEAGSLIYTRDFAKGRRVVNREDGMNRLYMVESGLSLTGSMADHRLRLATCHMTAFAAALAAKVTGDASLSRLAAGLDLKPEWIRECAADLAAFKGESLVVAGSHLPPAVHALAYAINAALGNIGSTVDFVSVPAPAAASIEALASAIRAGSVKTLFILGGNPVYNAPADLKWAELQKSVGDVIRFGYYVDETSAQAGTHLAAAHYLESWGDARTIDGTLVPIQPMILPLFGGLTEIEILARLSGETVTEPHALVLATFGLVAQGESFEKFLRDGLLPGSGYLPANVEVKSEGLARLTAGPATVPALSLESLEVRFLSDLKVDDGRFANNGWLQECPDPMTKVSWDNLILVSPRLGKHLGIESKGSVLQIARDETAVLTKGKEGAPIATLTVDGRTIRGPLHIQPGLSNFTVVVSLGYGRSHSGRIGQGAGYDAYPLRSSASPHVVTGVTLKLTGETLVVANVQNHWSMEGRDIVREANLEEFQRHPDSIKETSMESETPPVLGEDGNMPLAQQITAIPRGNSLYKTPEFDGVHQWGMSIDLNTCTGCNACVVACQSENNIPIVGKDQAIRGREMHWIRIDRYFSDGHVDGGAFGGAQNRDIPEDPQVSLQPLNCQQCELAPCEMVCPVNATVHDDEGLNVMAYNRCIGTRYCANNCPYKVRRFNYFDYNERHLDSLYMGPLGPHGMPELVKMVKNPEVSIRMRGVMEKCTYCVQRIENGKIQWKVQAAQDGHPGNVMVADGHIKTACQQACPAEAILFGNILDPNSKVAQAKAQELDYALLGYLNTRPRTTYLAKLRNPNPRMPDYKPLPASRIEHKVKNTPPGFKENGGES